MIGLRLRQGNLRLVFRLFSLMRGLSRPPVIPPHYTNLRLQRILFGIKHVVEQGNKATFALLKTIRFLKLPYDIQIEMFDKTVKPILLYGSEIWGYGNGDIIERVQLKFLKHIFKLKRSTPNHTIYGELGIFPIHIEIKA